MSLTAHDLGEIIAEAMFVNSRQARLNALVKRAYPTGGWSEYRYWIAYHGNPADQIENFENAGIILQPKQLELCSWARRIDNTGHVGDEQGTPEIGIGGARGPGKSFGLFAQAAVDDCVRFPGCKVLYLRKVGKKAREQLFDLVQAILGYVDHKFTQDKITFPNGSRILIGHFRDEKEALNYLGLEYDVIILEEATTLSGRAHEAMRNANRTSSWWRPRIYNSTNPLGPWHQGYKKRFIDHERKYADLFDRSRKFIFATVEDNKFVNEDYIGNLDSMTGVELEAYRYGNWDVSAGAYFDEYNYDRHTVEPFLELPRHWPIWASMDYGFQHWNMIYFHTKFDGVTYTFHEIAHRKHYVDEIVPDIKQALVRYGRQIHHLDKLLVGSDVFAVKGESRKTIAGQYEDAGLRLTLAETGPGSRIAGAHQMSKMLGNVQRGIDPTWKITRNCTRLLDTLPYMERNPNNPEDVKKVDCDEHGNGGDDAYDAVRYGLYQKEIVTYSVKLKKSGF